MTQQKIILNELIKRNPGYCSTTHLARLSGSFALHSQISKLRNKGWHITTKTTGDSNKKCFYTIYL